MYKKISVSLLFIAFGFMANGASTEQNSIAQLQFKLHSLGFDAGAVDGLWGGSTRRALQALADQEGVDFNGQLTDEAVVFVSGSFANLPLGRYPNETAHYTTMRAQHYEVFPLYDITCRAIFQDPGVGFDDLEEIKSYLTETECGHIDYKTSGDYLQHAIQSGVKLDFDGDGIRDQLVFFYGVQPNNPLTVLAFKLNNDYEDYTQVRPRERVSPIERVFQPEEVFSSGEYPIVQSARFLSVADFNNDGIEDIFASDDGYDAPPHQRHYSSKVFLSSPNGFDVEEVIEPRKVHGSAAGDVNGDGFIDIVIGWGGGVASGMGSPDSSRLFLNVGGEGFIDATIFLPNSLQKKNGRQPLFVELVDIDDDGYLDLFAGMGCGRQSKVFWNDGRGLYSDDRVTIAPLPYVPVTSQCNRDAPTNAHAIHLVQEETTGKRYLGI